MVYPNEMRNLVEIIFKNTSTSYTGSEYEKKRKIHYVWISW